MRLFNYYDLELKKDYQIGLDFLLQKNIKIGFFHYLHHVYDVNTKQTISTIFRSLDVNNPSNTTAVKISNGNVVEYYLTNVRLDDNSVCDYASYSPSDEITDLYYYVPEDISDPLVCNNFSLLKIPIDNTKQKSTIVGCTYTTMPEEYKILLEDFIYKDFIVLYTMKSTGLVVEYQRQYDYAELEENL